MLVSGGMKSKIYKLILGSLSITVIVNGLTISGADGGMSELVEGLLLMLILFVTIKTSGAPKKVKAPQSKAPVAAA